MKDYFFISAALSVVCAFNPKNGERANEKNKALKCRILISKCFENVARFYLIGQQNVE
jgi:hypothetical protein